MQTLSPLHNQFWSSISGRTWHTMPQYFNDEGQIAGCLEFSPTRHQLGHSVHLKSFSLASTPSLQTCEDTPSISADLNMLAGYQWLVDMAFPSSIISGVLSIMHPQMYHAGLCGIQRLDDWSSKHDSHMQHALCSWPMVFTNVSVIANWCSPLHRDPHSRSSWYDVLVNVGKFDHCVLDLPTLGVELLYRPGTMAAFSGRLIRHGVNAVAGNRCCLTYYMQDNIHHWLNVPRCDFVRVESLKWSLLDPQFMGVNTL